MYIPEKCSKCLIEQHDENGYGDEFNYRCPFQYKGYTGEIRGLRRADWCPMRPIPEKKPLAWDVSNEMKVGEELVQAGWNACIDELLKDGGLNAYIEAKGGSENMEYAHMKCNCGGFIEMRDKENFSCDNCGKLYRILSGYDVFEDE